MNWAQKIFAIENETDFLNTALEIFHYQADKNKIYQSYLHHLQTDKKKVDSLEKIPFLPIELFKTHRIITDDISYETIFKSSGTKGKQSHHYIKKLSIYKESLTRCFQRFWGLPSDYCILALLPNYIEQKESSLIFMLNELIQQSNHADSSFNLHNYKSLSELIQKLEKQQTKTMLWGVSYALMDFAENHPQCLNHTIVIETGGMKGRKEELTRTTLHNHLKKKFGLTHICSEYGMAELLSQAYSIQNEIFQFPPWAKILIRDIYDPFSHHPVNRRGGIDIIDLANVHSCSFISTMDIGILYENDTFEILGRFDNTDIRGCNLLVET